MSKFITENFRMDEFSCKCGCGFNNIDERLVHRLQVVRDIAGNKIKINSGCRCISHNTKAGGTSESYHLLGLAADWCFEGDDGNNLLEKLCTKLLNNWSGGFHYYPDQNFVHIDIGKRRRWT